MAEASSMGTSASTIDVAVNVDRSTSRMADILALSWFQQSCERGVEFQKLLLPKILKHPVWRGVLPNFSEMEIAYYTVGNIAARWQHIKECHSKDDQRARNVIIPMVVNQSAVSLRQTSLLTGIHRRNLSAGIVRRLSLEARTTNALWAFCGKERRIDAIPPEVCKLVTDFWTDNSRVSPNRKDVVRKRVAANEWTTHPSHHLMESQLSLYTRFWELNAGVEIGLRSFEALKPWYVKRLKEFNSCCCRYHVQMAELKDAFNLMRRGTLHRSCTCSCVVCGGSNDGTCQASTFVLPGVTAMCELILCPKTEDAEFHNLLCIRGDCINYGITKMKFCSRELDPDCQSVVTWRRFENVLVGQNEEGGNRHALRLEHKSKSPSTLVSYLQPKLAEFLIHNFEAKWQDAQFKSCMENLAPHEIVSVVDFVENYSFKDQNEVQSQHWFSFQVTILVHISFRLNPAWDTIDSSTRVLTEYHFYISDDKTHDNMFVQHCFSLHWRFLVEQGFQLPEEHIVFSDGCATQFKCSRSLFHVSRYPSLTRSNEMPLGCRMQWNYFGTGHGKGRWDVAGAIIKQALRNEQVKPNGLRLQSTTDVVTFLRRHLSRQYASYKGVRKAVQRHFYDVGIGDVNKVDQFNCRRVPGTRSFHQVRSVGLDKISLRVRNLSCFCRFCTIGGDGPCDSISHVPAYTLIRLEPCRVQDAQMDGQPEPSFGGTNRQALAAILEVDDHFAVVVEEGNSEGVDFYILLCQKFLHEVQEASSEDSWGQKVYHGKHIVVGTYYQRRGSSNNSYVLCGTNRPAFIYSHLVITTKFNMEVSAHRPRGGRGGTQVYRLTLEAEEHH